MNTYTILEYFKAVKKEKAASGVALDHDANEVFTTTDKNEALLAFETYTASVERISSERVGVTEYELIECDEENNYVQTIETKEI